MMYQLIQRVKKEDGTHWAHWTVPMDARSFKDAMEYFQKGMVPEWHKNSFLIVVIDENSLSLVSPEKWLRENGFID